jgi:DNA-binding IclR family transcriptional regulator
MSSVQSVRRALAIVDALADGPLGVTDVALRTRLPKSTTARLLATLLIDGVVEQLPDDARYRLGGRFRELSRADRAPRSLIATARPDLEALASAVGEAVGLSVPDGDLVRYIDQVSVSGEIQVRDWTGSRIPMHVVSSGLVFLAHRAPERLTAYLARPLERFTARSMIDPAELRARLRQVVRDGTAWTIEEYAEGLASVAAGVADADGEVVAAIHIHGPAYRFPPLDGEAELAREVIAVAAAVSRRLRRSADRP